MPTRVTRVISRRMRTNVLELCSPELSQSNKQNGDVLWLRMETNGVGKRDSVLSKIIKSFWKILFLSHFCPNVALGTKHILK